MISKQEAKVDAYVKIADLVGKTTFLPIWKRQLSRIRQMITMMLIGNTSLVLKVMMKPGFGQYLQEYL